MLTNDSLQSVSQLLGTAISPVALISGVGLLLLSITNRFTSTLSRLRTLTEAYDQATEVGKEKITFQISILFKRARRQRLAIVFSLASVLCVGVVIAGLFTMALFSVSLKMLVLFLFLASVLLLICSLLYFLGDIWLSLKALKEEIKNKI